MAVIANFSSILEIGFALNVAGAVYFDKFVKVRPWKERAKGLRHRNHLALVITRYNTRAYDKVGAALSLYLIIFRMLSELWMGICCLIILWLLLTASFNPAYAVSDGVMWRYLVLVIFAPLGFALVGTILMVVLIGLQLLIVTLKTDAAMRIFAEREVARQEGRPVAAFAQRRSRRPPA